jgi:hypothetical protein
MEGWQVKDCLIHSPWTGIRVVSQLADFQTAQWRQAVAAAAVLEVVIFSPEERTAAAAVGEVPVDCTLVLAALVAVEEEQAWSCSRLILPLP